MVQLSDDSAHGSLMNLDQAVERLKALAQSTVATLDQRLVSIDQSINHITAQPLSVMRPVPFDDNSAVDGYAFNSNDLNESSDSTSLRIMHDSLYAGHTTSIIVAPGHAVAITTGAVMPTGADTVCMLEDCCDDDGNMLTLPLRLKPGSNVRPSGEDFRLGDILVDDGTRITSRHIAALIAGGYGDVYNGQIPVFAAPSVLIASTGDELSASAVDGVRDSNGPMLSTLLGNGWGVDCVRHPGAIPDDLDQVVGFFAKACQNYNVILTSGAVSTGERDYFRQGFERAGGTVDFWKIGIKPGRPVAVGTLDNCLWIGLPGNPVAALVTALEVALPALRHLAGETPAPRPPGYWVRLADSYRKKAKRREFVRVRVELSLDPESLPTAKKFHKTGAGMISGLTWSDGLAVLDEDATVIEPGTAVWFTPWTSYRL